MTSQPPANQHLDPLEQLLATTRGILKRYPRTHRLLGATIDDAAANHAEITELRHAGGLAIHPPQVLVDVLRAPSGPQQIVNLPVHGRVVHAVICPTGRHDVRVERQVWQLILRTVGAV